MKKLFIFFLFFNCTFFYSQLDSLQRKRLETQLKNYKERCKLDSIRASADSKLENKYFLPFVAPNDYYIPFENELREIFEKNKIIYGGIDYHSDIPLHYSNAECYNSEMNRYTFSKFGEDFINDLINESVKRYIEDPRNQPLEMQISTPFGRADIDLKINNFATIIYRKPYSEKRKIYKSHQYIEILLDKAGKIIKFRELDLNFIDSKKTKNKFLKDLNLFFKKQNLKPATYYHYNVSAWIPLAIDIIY